MIVRNFLQWVGSAPVAARADATAALARAYLYSELSDAERLDTEDALTVMLDDPAPLVRQAMAEALAASPYAPVRIVHALAQDRPSVATIMLSRSPLFPDADLVDRVGAGDAAVQAAIAGRVGLSAAVAAAVAEVGSAEACLILIENGAATIAPFSLERVVDRYGHLAAVREALFARDDLPAIARQSLTATLSQTLVTLVTGQRWLRADRVRRVAADACERATVVFAAGAGGNEMGRLLRHLRDSGQLTASLVLRALLSGNVAMFEEALAELSGATPERVGSLLHDAGGHGLRALLRRAGLPESSYRAVRCAIEAMGEIGYIDEADAVAHLNRRIVERVLTACEDDSLEVTDSLLELIRRFSREALREEARARVAEAVAA